MIPPLARHCAIVGYFMTHPYDPRPGRNLGRVKWTPADDEYALSGMAAGKTETEIAIALGRSRSSVAGRLWKLKNGGLVGK